MTAWHLAAIWLGVDVALVAFGWAWGHSRRDFTDFTEPAETQAPTPRGCCDLYDLSAYRTTRPRRTTDELDALGNEEGA